ncbi:hypothetical protein CYY_006183 [Polysphondylium violaceum]|uniref:AMP-dependent synthetase/ligase domain-containing protein n=1 Tax=Polysphondylium violaceum TaxID=133409 RepID=A0A8J4URN6_9MYCE|nr:hypothetical protein CYY_006183 [Polysphondylium violaceum]
MLARSQIEKVFLRYYTTSTFAQKAKFKVGAEETIGSKLDSLVSKFGYSNAISIPDSDNFTLNYIDLNRNVKGLASGFVEGNNKVSDVVLTNVPQGLEHVIINLASSSAGLQFASVNPEFTFEQIGPVLKSSNAKTLIIGDNNQRVMVDEAIEYFPELQSIYNCEYFKDNRFPSLKHIVSTGRSQQPGISLIRDINIDTNLLKKRDIKSSQLANIAQLSDGKFIGYTQNQLLNAAESLAEFLNIKPNERLSLFVPLFQGNAFVLHFAHLISGAMTALCVESNSTNILNSITQDKCTSLYVSQKSLDDLVNSSEFSKADLSSLKKLYIEGDANPSSIKLLQDKTKCSVSIIHFVPNVPGQLSGVVFDTSSVGRVLPGVEVKIVDQKGNTVQQGTSGKVLTKGHHLNNNVSGEWLDTTITATMNKDGTIQL